MRWLLTFLVVAVGSAPSVAEESQQYVSDEGDAYFAVINASGAVLTSKYPKTWFHGESTEDHQVVEKKAVIYLGNSCDALHNEYGKGTWEQANARFYATFGYHVISFNRQELFGVQFDKCFFLNK